MRIEDDIKLDFDDVLIRPKRSTLRSRKDVDLNRTYTFKHSQQVWTGIPIMAANMDTTGTFEMGVALNEHNIMTVLHKFYTLEDWKNNSHMFFENNMSVSIGAKDDDLERFAKIASIIPNIRFLTIDVANGYGEYFADFIKRVRERYPSLTIIAGNVVTGEMTEQLILSGADVVKCGIGGGSGCLTRRVAGVGYPQLSSVIECSDAAHGLNAHIISDGGCRVPGDIAKAFGSGADFVMLGGMLAGHDESGGDIISEWHRSSLVVKDVDGTHLGYLDEEKKFKEFYGMSSDTAQKKYYGEQKKYRASEGRTVKVPYRGPVENTVQEILGGLRSTLTYVGAPSLKQLSKCTTFVRVNRQVNNPYDKA